MSRLKLILDIEYELNGCSLDIMKNNLEQMVFSAIGVGSLTGNTDAEIETYSLHVEEN